MPTCSALACSAGNLSYTQTLLAGAVGFWQHRPSAVAQSTLPSSAGLRSQRPTYVWRCFHHRITPEAVTEALRELCTLGSP
jgi:hypothetical protein